jgi:hypothetical protein
VHVGPIFAHVMLRKFNSDHNSVFSYIIAIFIKATGDLIFSLDVFYISRDVLFDEEIFSCSY